MKLSANEISALCVKAARGAGLPLGHAEDIGRASIYLAQTNTLDALCTALEGDLTQQTPIKETIPNAKIAACGPTVLDLIQTGVGPITLENPDAPELMQALAHAIQGAGITATESGLELSFNPQNPKQHTPHQGALDVPQDTLDTLNKFAAKTYVPATEASRLAGAGAGLTDND